ncbi:MAG: leucine--tRNA ligase [Acidimicrobiia bacterium]|nr:leucine--tRNA ligase [Acidimicrobiia bacterium]
MAGKPNGWNRIADVTKRTRGYDHRQVEAHWQKVWEETGLYRSQVDWDRPKHYALTMLPYPSGDLHIGHWYAMTPSDARARYLRMKGYNVLFPMGFDAFGLPAENAAVQNNIHPWKWTYANIERMRGQLRSMGTMIDWEREAVSCTPEYYRWTEWFFSRLHEAGLAYRGEALVNWSPTLQTVLANEQVIDGKDERTGQPVIQRMMEQWFFRITDYAEELLDFSGLDWPEPIKAMQTNWIGRSPGARVRFPVEGAEPIEVFTTRPDTLHGATFMVLSPEHPLVDVLTTSDQAEEVRNYRDQAARRSELQRTDLTREKHGVFTGGYALNPVTGGEIPVWIADYVLMSYGTGAIMAVPGEDTRDWEFADRYGLPVVHTVQPPDDFEGKAYEGDGPSINSDFLDGLYIAEAKPAMIDWLQTHGHGEAAVQYRLRDWLISRQRYWGSPIPVIYCQDGTIELVSDEDLPVELPEEVEFKTTGPSPLLTHDPFLKTTDSKGEAAVRETDTMDTFMCSSWYQLRYLSPGCDYAPFDPEEAAYWLPVDTYTGGAEHAVMHLLYTRFFTKALRDMGCFDDAKQVMSSHGRDPNGLFDEPMLMLRNQGQVLGEERRGDQVLVTVRRQDEDWVADSVQVVTTGSHPSFWEDGRLVGELLGRTEKVLTIASPNDDEDPITVRLAEAATVDVPSIEGTNTVNQLRHRIGVQRMSKSRGNVVNPDDLVEKYGADTVRTYLMFAFEWEKGGPWDSRGMRGAERFIADVWNLGRAEYHPDTIDEAATRALRRQAHAAIIKVGDDLESFSWNTAVAELMKLRNAMEQAWSARNVTSAAWQETLQILLLLLAPIAPHVTEEVWNHLGHPTSIHLQPWPEVDEEAAAEELVTMVVQVNGKVRARIEVPVEISSEDALDLALNQRNVARHVEDGEIRRVIDRRPKLLNLVV